jgi:hypothetical protein
MKKLIAFCMLGAMFALVAPVSAKAPPGVNVQSMVVKAHIQGGDVMPLVLPEAATIDVAYANADVAVAEGTNTIIVSCQSKDAVKRPGWVSRSGCLTGTMSLLNNSTTPSPILWRLNEVAAINSHYTQLGYSCWS